MIRTIAEAEDYIFDLTVENQELEEEIVRKEEIIAELRSRIAQCGDKHDHIDYLEVGHREGEW